MNGQKLQETLEAIRQAGAEHALKREHERALEAIAFQRQLALRKAGLLG